MTQLWNLGQRGKAECRDVDHAVAVATWLFMMARGGLSVFQEVYPWIRIYRETHGVLTLPKEVRRELLAAAMMVLMIGQDLTMGWCPEVMLFDASTEGGGVVKTSASWEELKSEARWAVRGNWITRTEPIQNFHDHYRNDDPEAEKIIVRIPRGVGLIRVYRFLHMFSGAQREKDLEWYLLRKGAAAGFRVIVESLDLAYGSEYDLGDQVVVERYVKTAKRYSGAHNGSPCSTWSRVRFQPGGPPPLRSREHPWGLPSNSKSQREHCECHNGL